MVLDGVVQQRGARHVRVGDPIVGQDPDGNPEQMVSVGFALPPVGRVQPGRQRQRVLARPRSAAGNQAISIASRSRSPASPCTEVIACTGIPASSRRSADPAPSPHPTSASRSLRPRAPPSPQAGYAWYAACSVTSASVGPTGHDHAGIAGTRGPVPGTGPIRSGPMQDRLSAANLAAYSRTRPEIRAACGAAVPTSSSTASADARGPVSRCAGESSAALDITLCYKPL